MKDVMFIFKGGIVFLSFMLLGFINIEAFEVEAIKGFEADIFIAISIMILIAVILGSFEIYLENKGLKLKSEIVSLFKIITFSPLMIMVVGILYSMITVKGYYSYGITYLFLTMLIIVFSRSIYRDCK